MSRPAPRDSQRWISHLIGFVGCVLFPALVTAIAPVSVTHFERRGAEVVADVKTNLFFLIPYRHLQIEAVTAVDDRFHVGERTIHSQYSIHDSRHETHSEDQAFLVIHGRDGQAEVSVSPVNIKSVLEKTRAFLAAPTERELRLVTVANWKFSVIAGGLVSLLTLLYFVGVTIGLVRFIARLCGWRPKPS